MPRTHAEIAYLAIKHAMGVNPRTKVGAVPAFEMVALAAMVLRQCPTCQARNWSNPGCELCRLCAKLVPPSCPLPAVGADNWKWEAQGEKWASPKTRFWIARFDPGFIVDSDDRNKYTIVRTLREAKRAAERMARDEWKAK